ncbi:MAG: 1,4-alpha-glucan branching protein GlgB [Planctomycetota bacterium]|mgnify:CR=1 FL=1
MRDSTASAALSESVEPREAARLIQGNHSAPHGILGAHELVMDGKKGAVVRVFHPDALRADIVLPENRVIPAGELFVGGLFGVFIPSVSPPFSYRVRFHFADGAVWERDDPYRFPPTLGEWDLHLFNEGTHGRLWERMGAQIRTIEGVTGVAFSVWAPNAVRVSVVGEFCRWDGRLFPMRQLGSSGVFELFIPDLNEGTLYKFEMKTGHGDLRLKTDPLARSMERPPSCASRVVQSHYEWRDREWMERRGRSDITREPMAIYEVHVGSWRRVPEEGNRMLTYREIAPSLARHAKQLSLTHIELMPIAEHPLLASWGYQVTGYYAPTSVYGTPDDFKFLVDHLHESGIGVILDWVPAHFPRDDYALRRFDGTALYEHDDPRRGEHPDWGTLIFNYGRREVRSFLLSNALYWLKEFHIDGLRVDAVASMLYLDYSRRGDDWMPNPWGGKENVEAIDFLRSVNDAIRGECPGCFTIAEESTGWSGVTAPTANYGLGFTFKWNMGWMHDTLQYFSRDSVHRKHHHNDLTFAMLYEHSEKFINPLSHDEVVHGKQSLLEKMPGDGWQKFANLRLLMAYQYTRPGKKLWFMGTEIAPSSEWVHDASLDWHQQGDPSRLGMLRLLEKLGTLYLASRCLWYGDPDSFNFYWIDCGDWEQSVLSYARQVDGELLITVLNLTPVPRDDYRMGVPLSGSYTQRLNTDDPSFGGSGYPTSDRIQTHSQPIHGFAQSLCLRLPPLAALVLAPDP